MVLIAYILSIAVIIYSFREIYKLTQGLKNREYLYGDWQHNLQHIIIMFLVIIVLITMHKTCGDEQKIPIIAYNMIMLLFILPHLSSEFKKGTNYISK